MPSRRQVLAAGSLALVGGSGCARIRDADDVGEFLFTVSDRETAEEVKEALEESYTAYW